MPGVVVVFVGSTGTHPCVAGVDGFLSSIISEVIDYLVNGDVPTRVLRETSIGGFMYSSRRLHCA
jgi:NCAIR mutase (PurE)-related protein